MRGARPYRKELVRAPRAAGPGCRDRQQGKDLRELLAESIIEIRAGKLDPRVANALGYLGASYLRALEVSEIESRLDALEAQQRLAERAFLPSKPAGSEQTGGGA